MSREDVENTFDLRTVPNHDPRLVLLIGCKDDESGRLYVETQPITAWLVIIKKDTWQAESTPVGLTERSIGERTVIYNTETGHWWDENGDSEGEGRKEAEVYLGYNTKSLQVID